MKNVFKSAIVLIVSAFGLTTNAQTQPTENSLLWEVSGNDLTKPSYLYGTMHMMCEKDFLIKDKVKSAFEKSGVLALEIDFDEPSELQFMQDMATSSESLSKVLSKEEYHKLDEFLKGRMGLTASQFENSNLITIMSIVMMKALNCPPKMFEFEFMGMAAKRKIEIIGLEKAQEQISCFENSYSNKEFIDQLEFYDTNFFDEMSKIYNSEKLDELYAIAVDEKFMDKEAKRLMLDNRNKNWVVKMPELMKKESVFFAVGAAHLSGTYGVINLLKEKGYKVKPILN
ncbi:TraB/GumN family protein [Flavobacterium sp. W1B]|uniref:TraB/GumN family protein n=1 Tax=Flavobacterium sp. W1B TaxID=3394146 RepID=UPI0039BCEB67